MKQWMMLGLMLGMVFAHAPETMAEDVASQCERLYLKKQQAAFPICQQAAEQGHSQAQYHLGLMYKFGLGVKQNYTQMATWTRKSAEQGNAMAQAHLAGMYFVGQGVPKNYKESAKWYLKAAEQGDANAQQHIGYSYKYGLGVKQDIKEGVKWLRKAAEGDDISAQYGLGVMYNEGDGVSKDYEAAAKWFMKAAKQGDSKAQFNLGVAYALGKGVMQSRAAAMDWYYKAGISFLKEGKKDNALRCAERMKHLQTLDPSTPNAFLVDKLLQAIYGGGSETTQAPAPRSASPKQVAKEPAVMLGTGWPAIVGYVVTNHHVIAGKRKITLISTDGTEIPATVAMRDAANDLTLLKVKNPAKLPLALPLAKSSAHIGAKVFTIGYPHPTVMGAKPKLTDGTVSSTTGLGDDPRAYQISVPLQAGNSGGPLLNMNGEVVGIVTAKLRAAKMFKVTGDLPQNVNYAVKASYLKALLDSVSPSIKHIRTLPANKASLEELAARIKDSVLIVVAE